MPRSRIDKSALAVAPVQPVRRPDERKEPKYLPLVKRLCCLVCGRRPPIGELNDPHHLMVGAGEFTRGTSLKAPDRFCVPLCRSCHGKVTDAPNDEEWFAARGIDGRGIAKALYAHRNDEAAMERIVNLSLLDRRVYG